MSDEVLNVIEDSLNDAQIDDSALETTETVEAPESTETVEVEGADPDKTVTDAPSVESIVKEDQVDAPVEVVEDEFAKKFGLSSRSVTGRENRIPYSRVKKIIQKNEKELTDKLTKEYTTKYQPIEDKVKGYEERLGKVAEFEKVLENDPKTFLELLSQVPAYKPFFDYINQLETGKAAPEPEPNKLATTGDDPRPMPNKQLADGSKVYDLDGLDQLMAWQARQVEKKVSADLETRMAKRYEPIEQEWKHKEYLAKIAPAIDKQISEARQWPHFTEIEGDIVKILQADKNISLDGAYRKALSDIILPKLSADRTKMRSEVIAELKNKPASTSVGGGKTAPVPKTGPRSLEEIIAAEIAKAGG